MWPMNLYYEMISFHILFNIVLIQQFSLIHNIFIEKFNSSKWNNSLKLNDKYMYVIIDHVSNEWHALGFFFNPAVMKAYEWL